MTDTLADSVRAIAPFIEQKLISPHALSNISQVGSILPAIPIVSEAGFECRLGVDAPEADFLMSFSRFNSGCEMLAGQGSTEILPKSFFSNPVWNTIRHFCTHWLKTESVLHKNVTDVWLEFDVEGTPLALPEPSFFFGPKELKSVSDYQWVTEDALTLLLGTSLNSQVKHNLLTCFKLLPANAQAFQIGVMLSRQVESSIVRVCVRDIPNDKILEYLISIGWDGDVRELESIIDTLSHFVDDIRLNFAVGDRVFTKIGFECYFERKPVEDPELQAFLDYLVERKLCNVDKRNALLAWPGYSHEKSHKELWPEDLLKTSTFLNARNLSAFVRLFHHAKIVYQPNKPLEAKAYLWFGHAWIHPHFHSASQFVLQKVA